MSILTITLSDEAKNWLQSKIANEMNDVNPYLSSDGAASNFASDFLHFISNKERTIDEDKFSQLITTTRKTGACPVFLLKNGPHDPIDSIIPVKEDRGFDYAKNPQDRMKKFFFAEWFSWLVAELLDCVSEIHPTEHGGGNRFHLISPVPKLDTIQRQEAASTGGGELQQHSDATAYNEFKSLEEINAALSKLNTNIFLVSQAVGKPEHLVVEELLCGKYVKSDFTILVGILNDKTPTSIGTVSDLESHLYKNSFEWAEIERLSKMPVAHIPGVTYGEIQGYVANIVPPIFVADGKITGTCLNSARGRMVYVGSSEQDKLLFEKFVNLVVTMPTTEVTLKATELLFMPNYYKQVFPNITHGRKSLLDAEYSIDLGNGTTTRRMLCRLYASSRNGVNHA